MRLFALLCLLLLAATGCGSSATTPTPRPQVATSLQWGVVGVSDVPTLDPSLVSDPTSIGVASLIYGGLVRLDRSLHVQPDGATHWTISRDGKIYTFTLRKGLRFASGKPVTAADFVSTLDAAIGGRGASSTASTYLDLIARGRKGVPAIHALSARTLQISLVQPAAHFLAELAFPISFLPDPSLPDRFGASWTDHAGGFGPYRVASWRHSKYLQLERNPYFYGAKPRLKRITLHFYSEKDALNAYREGNLDLVSGYGPGETIPGHLQGVQRVHLLALDYLAFNTTRPPFRRVDVRKAFAAIWSPNFVTHAMGSTAFPATGLLPAAFRLKTASWKPSLSPSKYLAAGRYPHGKGFPPVTLVMPRDAGLHSLGLALRRSWQRFLGIDVAVRQLNLSNYLRVLNDRTFDLAFVRWGADYPDPQDFLGTQLGSSNDNVTGWSGKQYDRLVPLADSYNPLDPRRSALFQHAAAVATAKVPILPMDEPAQAALVRRTLHGVSLTPLGTVSIDPAKLRFSS